MENPLQFPDATRRDVLRKTVFVAPVILSLPVIPSFAKAGSESDGWDESNETNNPVGSTDTSGGSQAQPRRRRRHHWLFFSW